ncbi:DUF4157 domain-containing protein [Actinomadura soli]|uniref:DUF4157 domain-containing protein n=1 Tax=Actinomadura soli TaxID=2508997 RepID=A0A5C4JFU3_9ACTN|nr:DUF4157 domain-containing protein [Actinomadura soli]TMR04174.1 DUF4157 domain-containing protein [Actinomadura soli]
MREQVQPDKQDGGKRASDIVSRSAATPTGPESALLALQREVGNAAVTAALERRRHVHHSGCGHGPAVQRSAVHDVLRSSGRPLDDPLRADMEQRLGADFSDVRIHDDAVAQRSAAEIGARAYTSGTHVVVGEGGADEHTLAHELTHVIQQRSGPVEGTDNGQGLSVSDPGDRFEREAEATARRVMSVPPGDAGPVGGALLGLQRLVGNAAVGRMLAEPESTGERNHRREERARHSDQSRVQRAPMGTHIPAVVQRVPHEELSGRVRRRLRYADQAIHYLRRAIPFAANQREALVRTLFNSSLRAQVVEHDDFWDISGLGDHVPSPGDLAAAKALYAGGGTCESYSDCTFSCLRRVAEGEYLRTMVSYEKSHTFVIIGEPDESPSEWVVVDPWPTRAEPVRWVDHFCYSADMEWVQPGGQASRADGNDTVNHISHQIRLRAAGELVAGWDLSAFSGCTSEDLGRMLQREGVAVDLHQEGLTDRVLRALGSIDSWSTSDIGDWSDGQLNLWCLAQIDQSIIRHLLERSDATRYRTGLYTEVENGIDRAKQEYEQETQRDYWVRDVRSAQRSGRTP